MEKEKKEKLVAVTFRIPESVKELLADLTHGQNYGGTKALCRAIREQHRREFKKGTAKKS